MKELSPNKRIAKNTIILYLRQLFTLFLALYTSRLTLQVLGITDYGIFAAVGGVTAFLSILTSSFSSSTQRFLTFSLGQGDNDILNKTYVCSINIHIFLSLLLLIFAETIGLWFLYNKMQIPVDRLDIAFFVYEFSVIGAFFVILNSPNTAEIIAHEDMGIFAFISVADALLKLFGVVFLFHISLDKLLVYSGFLLLINILNSVITYLYCRCNYSECRYKLIWDKNMVASMFGLAGWNTLSGISIMGFIQGTNILLNMFFGPLINSAYAVASQAYSGIRSFTSNFQLASNPQIVKLYSRHEMIEMHTLLMRVCKYSFFLLFLMSFPFVLNANYVLDLWLDDVPDYSSSFFVLLLVFSYIDVMAYPLDVAAQSTGSIKKYCIFVSTCIISILPLSYLLFRLGFMPETILYIAIVVAVIGISIRLFLLHSMIYLPIYTFIKEVYQRPIVCVLIISIVTIPFDSFHVVTNNVQRLLFFVYIFLSEVTIVYYVGLNRSEKQMIKQLISKVKQKFMKR